MASYRRLYAFLSQIFDYGSTAIEARYMFYRHLINSLDFGRERDTIDLSKVVLTHHRLNKTGQTDLVLNGDAPKLKPLTDTGTASVQDQEKALLSAILGKLNDMFSGVTDNDQLAYVAAIKGALLDNSKLAEQAQNNMKDQFASSPALKTAVTDAIIDAYAAHSEMSRQALGSAHIQEGLIGALIGYGQLYEALRNASARL